jgi:hypothetical protein
MFQEKFSRTKCFVFDANSMGFNDQLENFSGKFNIVLRALLSGFHPHCFRMFRLNILHLES